MKKETVTLDIIYGTKELDIPLQLITFVILDNEPYDKCKAIIYINTWQITIGIIMKIKTL